MGMLTDIPKRISYLRTNGRAINIIIHIRYRYNFYILFSYTTNCVIGKAINSIGIYILKFHVVSRLLTATLGILKTTMGLIPYVL